MRQTLRVPIEERARRYLATLEAPRRAPDDPQDSHTVVFNAARVLVHGFGFTLGAAYPLLKEYLERSDMPWSEHEIHHKLRSVDAIATPQGRGYLLEDIGAVPHGQLRKDLGILPESERKKKVEFDPAKLAELAGPWRDVADLVWLANRSALDPATVTTEGFLRALYPKGEQILLFNKTSQDGKTVTQGEALWPGEKVLHEGKLGVWFLPQPVDGKAYPNPRAEPHKDGSAKMSRRSEESVTAFRYMLLESDEAPPRDWLGFIVQAPLRIEALYTSGGRSIHALVRVDCRTKKEWDAEKQAMMPFLMAGLMLGADRGTWSAVRLSRLPGCWREGKMSKDGRYVRYPMPALQKLLYLRPNADVRPICELPAVRDVEAEWLKLAALGVSDADETGGAVLKDALNFYSPVSKRCREALRTLET